MITARRTRADLDVDRDVRVTVSDGARLALTVYRARDDASPRPVVMSMTPYGKDRTPDRIGMAFMRAAGVRFGRLDVSALAGFESPDPAFWVAHGYIVVQGDVRGMGRSEGHAGFCTDRDALDYAELIEWVATRPWCTGRVGLCGVSYLAMSQWRVAATRPPHLSAIIPWEGLTDPLRDLAFHGGIPETRFTRIVWRKRFTQGRNRSYAFAEDFHPEYLRHSRADEYWAAKTPDLARITVPALVGASWSDASLHSRGSILGFEQIGSTQKWLYAHGARKWQTFYSTDARQTQLAFFDHFLRGVDNGWQDTPAVRLEVRHDRRTMHVHRITSWPDPRTQYRRLHLDATTRALAPDLPASGTSTTWGRRGLRFSHTFAAPVDVTGSMWLRLTLSSATADADVFVAVRKRRADGVESRFHGYSGMTRAAVAYGWLRASRRGLDPVGSRRGRPRLAMDQPVPLTPDEPTPVDVEIWPSSTRFDAGDQLVVDLGSRERSRFPVMRHQTSRTARRGGLLHTGPGRENWLDLPVTPH